MSTTTPLILDYSNSTIPFYDSINLYYITHPYSTMVSYSRCVVVPESAVGVADVLVKVAEVGAITMEVFISSCMLQHARYRA